MFILITFEDWNVHFKKECVIFSPDSKKFEEAIDLRTNDDVTEIEVEKKVSVKSQFKVRKFFYFKTFLLFHYTVINQYKASG